MTQLALSQLASLPRSVATPVYQRSDLSPGIVHFGVGNFHRAHQAAYLDALFNMGQSRDWAIVGAGIRQNDQAMREQLQLQDWLTTVVEQEAEHSSARVTGAMVDFLPVGDAEALLSRMADPAIRIVSMTITEGGYFIDPASGRFDTTHPDIKADAARPEQPRTVFGLILAGLKRRRDRGIAPFTVMSCDNIPHNGHVTRDAVAGLAELFDPALAAWVRESVAFPNSMVDRITPATTDRERRLLQEQFEISDNWPVFCESFTQWVLEDKFPAGRPALEAVGVTFVPDVAPYELMKIRILNGGHAAIAYPAALLDIHFVHEAMHDEDISAFLGKLERDEIIPVVPPVPDTDLEDYFSLIERRFSNPKIGDTIPRLCQDGSNRQPKFILPSAADRLQAGTSVTGLSLVSALWCRYLTGMSDSGKPIAINDPNLDRVQPAARAATTDPNAFLALGDIFGTVGRNAQFARSFARNLQALSADGTRATLQRYVRGAL